MARVATNLAIDRCRKRRPTVPIEERHGAAAPDGFAAAPDGFAAALERQSLVYCLRRLSARQREMDDVRTSR